MKDILLICPRNDEESLMILKIAKKAGISTLVSQQPHGAKLRRENGLIERIREFDGVKKLVIVELPGVEKEKELEDLGYEIVIIDHHRYDDLNRMQKKSSLEQFLEVFDISHDQLIEWKFDPKMIQAVAAIDRGFLWELNKLPWSDEEKKAGRAFYRSLTLELGGERREKEETAARDAWNHRREENGVLIIESEEDLISIRDAISFMIADNYKSPPQTLIRQGRRRLYVQDTPHAVQLHEIFGGFTFGQDKCWGILKEDRNLPDIKEILDIIVE